MTVVGPDTTPNRLTALVKAIRNNSTIPDLVIQYILEKYADHIDFDMISTDTKDTLLHEMIIAQRTECTRTLLEALKEKKKLDDIINKKNASGETPLFVACKFRFIQLAVDMVKCYGADPDIMDDNMEYPYERAKAFPFFVSNTGLSVSQSLIPIPDVLKPSKPLSKEKRLAMSLKKAQKSESTEQKSSEKEIAEEEEEEINMVEEDEDEEKPRRSKRKSARARKTYNDDLTDTLSEEVEEKPKKRKGRKKASKSDAVEEEESEQEEKPRKKKAASKRKKEEKNNAEESEENEEEEEEQPKKKKKQAKPRTSRKKK